MERVNIYDLDLSLYINIYDLLIVCFNLIFLDYL